MNENQHPVVLDDWLEEGLENAVHPTPVPAPKPESRFPTVPSGVGVKKEQPQAAAADKPKTLADMGITRGGVVRNPSTVVRTQLENPVTNARPNAKVAKPSVLDSADLPPEFGVPGTLMTSMDADLEQRAKDRINAVTLPKVPEPANNRKPISFESTLKELLAAAISNEGTLRLATANFVIEIQITA